MGTPRFPAATGPPRKLREAARHGGPLDGGLSDIEVDSVEAVREARERK